MLYHTDEHLHNIHTLRRCNSGLCKTALSQGCNPVPALPLQFLTCLVQFNNSLYGHSVHLISIPSRIVEYSEENHTRKQVHTPSKETAMLSGPSCKTLEMKLLHLVSESAETNIIRGCSQGIVYFTLKKPGLENNPF